MTSRVVARPSAFSIAPWSDRLGVAYWVVGLVGQGFVALVELATGGSRFVVVVTVALAGLTLLTSRWTTVGAGALITASFALSATDIAFGGDAFGPILAECGALALVAGPVARSSPAPWALGLTVGVFSAQVVSNLVATDVAVAFVLTILVWASTAGAAGVGLYLRLAGAERDRALLDARNTERIEIARELHDTVAHHVTGMLIQAQAAQLLVHKDADRAEELMADVESAGNEVMGAMRQMVKTLRDAEPASMNSSAAILDLVTRAEAAGLQVELELVDIPPELGPTIVRLTREALTNVRKHSPRASTITIAIERTPSGIDWTVTNDGSEASARPASNKGYGLVGMRERVETLGGTFTAGHTDAGWVVAARLPTEART